MSGQARGKVMSGQALIKRREVMSGQARGNVRGNVRGKGNVRTGTA